MYPVPNTPNLVNRTCFLLSSSFQIQRPLTSLVKCNRISLEKEKKKKKKKSDLHTTMATLMIPPVLSSPRDDAMHLYKAFKGLGCDTSAVINILAHRDASQRALIENEYKIMYSEDLTKRLSSELSGNLKKAVLLWMPDPARRDAMILKETLTTDIDLKAATEVICSRTPTQLQHLKQLYHVLFGSHLEHDIQTQTSGDLGQFLLAYLSTPRSEGCINGEMSGNFEHALVTVLQCAENPGKYFAKVMHRAMKGLGTNDKTLIRVIVTRTEIDMQYIKAEYYKKHHKSLNDVVHSETSDNYRTFLLSLLGPNQH
ncbi:hypothetical protein L1987_61641 [Smallanthus sonchifolius]|uniref:Uncharacterized protein n=1 Tax=Smallanthus sonchifolius TaxID=185202 RepID=A0ACB9C855_9ASTR|nr:hypothetical protein L1987_61641 [Smallanthus sonchifolius]